MQATAAIVLLLMSGNMQPALAQVNVGTGGAQQPSATAPAQQAPTGADQNLPPTPAPKLTEPLYLRDTDIDYTHLYPLLTNPAGLSGAGWQDLSEFVGRRSAGAGE